MANKEKYKELTGKPFDPPKEVPEKKKKPKGPAQTPAPNRAPGEKSKKVLACVCVCTCHAIYYEYLLLFLSIQKQACLSGFVGDVNVRFEGDDGEMLCKSVLTCVWIL